MFLSLSPHIGRALVLYRTLSLVSLLSFTRGLSSRWILVIDAISSHSAREIGKRTRSASRYREEHDAHAEERGRGRKREKEREMLLYTCLRIRIERERKRLSVLRGWAKGGRGRIQRAEVRSHRRLEAQTIQFSIQFSMIQQRARKAPRTSSGMLMVQRKRTRRILVATTTEITTGRDASERTTRERERERRTREDQWKRRAYEKNSQLSRTDPDSSPPSPPPILR